MSKGQLAKIGAIAPFYGPYAQGLGSSFENGFFYDVYDWLELNPLTNHADAPRFDIVMREENGVFVADLDRTWGLSRDRFAEQLDRLPQRVNRKASSSDYRQKFISPLLFCATLAKYCGRKTDMERVMRRAKDLIPESEYLLLKGIVDHSVVTGDTPHSTVERLIFRSGGTVTIWPPRTRGVRPNQR